jgi:hypothetical protein
MSGGGSRGGTVLLETLLALSLGVFVLGSFAGVLAACLHWTRGMIERSESLEVVRTVWVVLDEELRPGLHERDWFLESGGVVSLRSFQGSGPGVWTFDCRGPLECGLPRPKDRGSTKGFGSRAGRGRRLEGVRTGAGRRGW